MYAEWPSAARRSLSFSLSARRPVRRALLVVQAQHGGADLARGSPSVGTRLVLSQAAAALGRRGEGERGDGGGDDAGETGHLRSRHRHAPGVRLRKPVRLDGCPVRARRSVAQQRRDRPVERRLGLRPSSRRRSTCTVADCRIAAWIAGSTTLSTSSSAVSSTGQVERPAAPSQSHVTHLTPGASAPSRTSSVSTRCSTSAASTSSSPAAARPSVPRSAASRSSSACSCAARWASMTSRTASSTSSGAAMRSSMSTQPRIRSARYACVSSSSAGRSDSLFAPITRWSNGRRLKSLNSRSVAASRCHSTSRSTERSKRACDQPPAACWFFTSEWSSRTSRSAVGPPRKTRARVAGHEQDAPVALVLRAHHRLQRRAARRPGRPRPRARAA